MFPVSFFKAALDADFLCISPEKGEKRVDMRWVLLLSGKDGSHEFSLFVALGERGLYRIPRLRRKELYDRLVVSAADTGLGVMAMVFCS